MFRFSLNPPPFRHLFCLACLACLPACPLSPLFCRCTGGGVLVRVQQGRGVYLRVDQHPPHEAGDPDALGDLPRQRHVRRRRPVQLRPQGELAGWLAG